MYHIQNIHPNGILSHFLSSGIFLLCNCFSSLTAQTSSSSASPPLSLSLCFAHFILVIPNSYISPLLVHPVVSDHTQTTERQMKPAKQRPTKHDREKYNTWRRRRKLHHLWETLCVFVCVWVYVLGGEAGGHGKLRTTSLYWCLEEKPYWSSPSFLFTSLPPSLTLSSLFHPSITSCLIFSFLAISPLLFSPSYYLFFLPSLHLSLSLVCFLTISHPFTFLSSLLLPGFWGKQGQEAAWLSDNGTHQNQKAAPTSPTSHTHTSRAGQTGHSSCRLHRIPRLG